MPTLPWSPGSATGIGSLPGIDPSDAIAGVLDDLPEFPYLPELPARGPGADMIGRTTALLIDLPVEWVAGRWRLASGEGRDMRRAIGWLRDDLDALEERASGYEGTLKIQLAGPWTLAGTIELRRGAKALADPGATRDLVTSLAEGMAEHLREVRKRMPGAAVLVQLDEPLLPAVLAGTVPTQSGLGALRAVEEPTAQAALSEVIAAAAPCDVIVHCCAEAAPVDLFMRAGARGFAVDFSLLSTMDEGALGAAVDNGAGLLAGVVPTVEPSVGSETGVGRAHGNGSDGLSVPAATVEPVRSWWRRLGLDPAALPGQVVLTPACGLAGASPAYARAATRRCREAARVLAEAPEG